MLYLLIAAASFVVFFGVELWLIGSAQFHQLIRRDFIEEVPLWKDYVFPEMIYIFDSLFEQ
jgi:hypothetical protein